MDKDFLHIDSILTGVKVTAIKPLLHCLARQAAQDTRLPEKYILDRLTAQEQRETSGIGGGVAIPHLRLARLAEPYTLFARLNRAVDAKALDGCPVDLVFLLLSPGTDVAGHLRRLSRISRLARSSDLRGQLSAVQSPDDCRAWLQTAASGHSAAA